jgi:hypothetical protein
MAKHQVGDLVVAKRVTIHGTMQPEHYNIGKVGEVTGVHTMGGESFYQVRFGHTEDMIDEVCLERDRISA